MTRYNSYRTEIDGLRAIAIVPVVLYHAGLPHFSGGFLGVDVFFVISGFLITGILLREKANDTFSLLSFYERRIRRIFPALSAVILVSFVCGWLLLMPEQFEYFMKSIVAVALFSSNFFFRAGVDYFGPTADEMPLLHTWSISVEEQFYILFPISLILLWRFARPYIAMFFLAALISSFSLSVYASHHFPAVNFYLIPTRAWELLVGVLAAFYTQSLPARTRNKVSLGYLNKSFQHSMAQQSFAVIGLLLILTSIVIFDSSMPNPGIISTVPTLGTALVLIFATKETTVGQILSIKPVRGVGLVSYSLYLWHVPIFVFASAYSLEKLSLQTMIYLSILSLFIAVLSWKFIEQPFRNRGFIERRNIFGAAAVTIAIFALAPLFVGPHFSSHPSRIGEAAHAQMMILKHLEEERNIYTREGTCYLVDQENVPLKPFSTELDCFGEEDFSGVLVVGDSTAADKASGLRLNDVPVGQLTIASCEMVPSLMKSGWVVNSRCDEIPKKVSELKQQGKLKGLILVKRMYNEFGELEPNNMEELYEFWLSFGVPLLIISSTPEFVNFKDRAIRSELLDVPLSLHEIANFAIAERSYDALVRHNKDRAIIIDGKRIYCEIMSEGCLPVVNGEYQILDAIHLTKNSARKFMARVIQTAEWKAFTNNIAEHTP